MKYYSQLNYKNKITIFTLSSLFLIFIIIYLVLLPAVSDIKNITESINNQKRELEKEYIKGQNIRNLTKKLDKVQDQIKLLDQAFISKNRGLDFITTLEGVADNSQVEQKINLLDPIDIKGGLYEKVPVQFSAVSDIGSLMNFLVSLETLNYYIIINSIEISSVSSQKDDSPGASMTILADSYWRK